MKILLLTLLLILSNCVKTESQITKERNEHAQKCYLIAFLMSRQNLPDINKYGTSEYDKYSAEVFNKIFKDLAAGYLCAEVLKPKNKNTVTF